ncbi:MAG: hypothetical protein JWP44_4736, partial [Mucilaginibacter sp.]|nr:hypothetical protein [Mucilaginibacter sp.]
MMRQLFRCILLAGLIFSAFLSQAQGKKDYTQFVNPF